MKPSVQQWTEKMNNLEMNVNPRPKPLIGPELQPPPLNLYQVRDLLRGRYIHHFAIITNVKLHHSRPVRDRYQSPGDKPARYSKPFFRMATYKRNKAMRKRGHTMLTPLNWEPVFAQKTENAVLADVNVNTGMFSREKTDLIPLSKEEKKAARANQKEKAKIRMERRAENQREQEAVRQKEAMEIYQSVYGRVPPPGWLTDARFWELEELRARVSQKKAKSITDQKALPKLQYDSSTSMLPRTLQAVPITLQPIRPIELKFASPRPIHPIPLHLLPSQAGLSLRNSIPGHLVPDNVRNGPIEAGPMIHPSRAMQVPFTGNTTSVQTMSTPSVNRSTPPCVMQVSPLAAKKSYVPGDLSILDKLKVDSRMRMTNVNFMRVPKRKRTENTDDMRHHVKRESSYESRTQVVPLREYIPGPPLAKSQKRWNYMFKFWRNACKLCEEAELVAYVFDSPENSDKKETVSILRLPYVSAEATISNAIQSDANALRSIYVDYAAIGEMKYTDDEDDEEEIRANASDATPLHSDSDEDEEDPNLLIAASRELKFSMSFLERVPLREFLPKPVNNIVPSNPNFNPEEIVLPENNEGHAIVKQTNPASNFNPEEIELPED